MPSLDIAGNLIPAPLQTGSTCVNVGTIPGVTVMIIVAIVAHWPASGVKVYVVVAVLSNAGDQVPLIPLLDFVGNAVRLPPLQIAATCVNVGTVPVTEMVIVAAIAHWPASGVNV